MAGLGLEPEFSPAVLQQLKTITGPAPTQGPGIHDMTGLPWCSIDNDDSRDLDQLSCCEVLPSGAVKLLVAVADVDALVHKNSPIDRHAHQNTTSVYTGARIFPMLPERLSTDLTSLNPHEDRLALVTTMVFNPDASLAGSSVGHARVRNRALARLTRSDSEARRCAVAATVAMAGERRRCMNSPMVCVPGMGRSRNSAMRWATSAS